MLASKWGSAECRLQCVCRGARSCMLLHQMPGDRSVRPATNPFVHDSGWLLCHALSHVFLEERKTRGCLAWQTCCSVTHHTWTFLQSHVLGSMMVAQHTLCSVIPPHPGLRSDRRPMALVRCRYKSWAVQSLPGYTAWTCARASSAYAETLRRTILPQQVHATVGLRTAVVVPCLSEHAGRFRHSR